MISDPITLNQLRTIAATRFGDMVKAVVDIKLRRMALGGDLHADQPRPDWVEFDSLVNIRPRQNNRSRSVESDVTRELIVEVVDSLVQ